MRELRYVVADVFTDVPLAGNQLAVFTDGRGLDEQTMQRLALEMNLSETVFVLPPSTLDADVRIRIFTPWSELPFAGHPTLGAAFVLGGPLQKVVIRLETRAGVVPVSLEREGARISFGWMEQPMPGWEAVRPERGSCSPRSASNARACPSSPTTSARTSSSSSSARPRRSLRSAPTSRPSRA